MVEKRIVTSLKIKPSLKKKLKIYAIEKDLEMSDVMELALLKYLPKNPKHYS